MKNPQKTLRKAAKRLRKVAKATVRYPDRSVTWSSTFIPARKGVKGDRPAYWVDAHTKSGSGAEGYNTVADVIWGLDDAVYIAIVQPKVALTLADLLDAMSHIVPANKSWTSESAAASAYKLAKKINKGYKARAKREEPK